MMQSRFRLGEDQLLDLAGREAKPSSAMGAATPRARLAGGKSGDFLFAYTYNLLF
jgi:hypothetical protein